MCYTRFLPQQLPGPAQLASTGDDPQHVVSPRPGKLFFEVPDTDAWGERSFLRLRLLHELQHGISSEPVIKISLVLPQSRQRYSNIGIGALL